MEKNASTKCEQFAWNDGLRIVDLCELSKQLHCKQCRSLLDLRHTEREARYGLGSILFILCKCGATNDVHTGKLQHSGQNNNSDPIFEVNTKASVNLLMFRADASRILGFLALLDIPVPASDDPALTPLLKDKSADSTFPQGLKPPSEMRALYSSPATGFFSVGPEVSGSSSSSPPSRCVGGSDGYVDSVPLVLPSHRHQGGEGDSDYEDNDNGCDNEQSMSSVGDLKERRKCMAIVDSSKADVCRRGDKTTCDIPNRPPKLENNKQKEEHTPPKKIRTKAQNLHGLEKPSTNPSRKTRTALTREPLKTAVRKVHKTRTKLKKDAHPSQTTTEQNTKQHAENNNVDFSNTLEWSSTESEPEAEASRDQHSDASREVEEEKETPAKPKRGRGRPKGSIDKVKRTRKRGRDATNSVRDAELKTQGAGSNGVPRCDVCGKDFSSARGYNVHVRRMHKHDGPLQEPASKRERGKQGEGGDEEEADSETKEPSVIAPEGGQWRVAMEEEVTAELFRCPKCCAVLADPKSLFFHTGRSHPTLAAAEKGRYYRIPLKDFVVKRKLVHANGTETIHYQCRKCRNIFSSSTSLGNHLCISSNNNNNDNNSNNNNSNDNNNSSSSSSNSNNNNNSNSISNNNNRIINNNNNNDNNTSSSSSNNNNNSISNNNNNSNDNTTSNSNNSNNNNNSPPQLSCLSLCPQGTKIRGKALELALRHDSPCLCNVCGKVYANRGILKTHMEAVHAAKSTFPCDLCGATFTRPSSLHAHAETHRTDRPRPFVCQMCGKRFFAASHLKKHERNQHGESGQFLCLVCGKEFSTRRSRDNHTVIHTGQRAFPCPQCSMKFYKRYNLTVHERIHSGVKPYKCAVCRLTFAQKNSLDVHVRKHGSGIGKDAVAFLGSNRVNADPVKWDSFHDRRSAGVEVDLRTKT